MVESLCFSCYWFHVGCGAARDACFVTEQSGGRWLGFGVFRCLRRASLSDAQSPCVLCPASAGYGVLYTRSNVCNEGYRAEVVAERHARPWMPMQGGFHKSVSRELRAEKPKFTAHNLTPVERLGSCRDGERIMKQRRCIAYESSPRVCKRVTATRKKPKQVNDTTP